MPLSGRLFVMRLSSCSLYHFQIKSALNFRLVREQRGDWLPGNDLNAVKRD